MTNFPISRMIESKQTRYSSNKSFIKLIADYWRFIHINMVDLQMRDSYRDEYIHVRNTVGDN